MAWELVAAFRASGEPKGQPRPRACIRGRHAAVYNPETADAWRHAVALAARRVRPASPVESAVRVVMAFALPMPKRRASGAPTRATKKPDIDNAAKLVMDVLTDARFWLDDAQVVCLVALKTLGTEPGVAVSVYKEEA